MMNQEIYLYLVYLVEFFTVVLSSESNICIVEKFDQKNGRRERALLFPPSSTIGVRVKLEKLIKFQAEIKLIRAISNWILDSCSHSSTVRRSQKCIFIIQF